MKSAKLLLILPALTAFAVAQQDSINARDMFFSIKDLATRQSAPQPPAPPRPRPQARPKAPEHAGSAQNETDRTLPGHNLKVVPNPLGLRYALLQRNSEMKFVETSPDATFRDGDLIRLSVMSNQRGYLYIIQKGSSGGWSPLFPDPRSGVRNNLIEPERAYEIPGGSGEAFRFEGQPGEERIFILLTRVPENDLDQLTSSLRRESGEAEAAAAVLFPSRVDDRIVDQIRNQLTPRDLAFSKFDGSSGEKAVYVVNRTASGSEARVLVDLTLNHR